MTIVAKSKKFEAREHRELPDEFTPNAISKSLDLPLDVSRILSDELSFLESHSSLLLRYRKTLTYFKNAGKLVLDLQNRAKDSKSKALHAIRGPRWILSSALPVSGFAIAGPLGALVGAVGSSVIAFSDP